MPELPEVETLCRQLRKKIVGRKIASVTVFDPKLDGLEDIQSARVVSVERSGKSIVIHLDDGRSLSIHLRMSGRLLWKSCGEKPRHGRWCLGFSDGNIFLDDPRRFATIKIKTEEVKKEQNDIFIGFDEDVFMKKQAGRKVNIKTMLMDPKAIAGIGNIYACEILYRALVSPRRKSFAVKRREWQKIFVQAEKILETAIRKRGTSISDWCDLYGRKGENQRELKVYGREGEKCSKCGKIIRRIKQGGRSTFYCPGCQK